MISTRFVTIIINKKRTFWIEDFTALEDHRVKIKENEIRNKYLDLVWELGPCLRKKTNYEAVIVTLIVYSYTKLLQIKIFSKWYFKKKHLNLSDLIWLRNEPSDFSFIIFTYPSARTGYDTRSILKQSLTGLNSEFSFS